jgi:hypothetical protein
MVVQNLIDLNAPLFEFWIKAVLQVGLVEPPMVVVTVIGEDLPNMYLSIYSQQSKKVHGFSTSFHSMNGNFTGFRKICSLFC